MLYIVTRTSESDEEVPPCEDARCITVTFYKDVRRYFKSKEEWLARFPESAKDVIEWGVTKESHPYRIVRKNFKIWVVEVIDITEFVKKYGRCIVAPPEEAFIGYEQIPWLEIYDDWRE